MQKIQILGYLGADAQIREFGNAGQKVVTFNVAVTRRYKDTEETSWYFCVRNLYGNNNGEKLASALKKGQRVLIGGSLTAGVYIPQDGSGKVVPSLRIGVRDIEWVDNKKSQDGQQVAETSETQVPEPPVDLENNALNQSDDPFNVDDLPF